MTTWHDFEASEQQLEPGSVDFAQSRGAPTAGVSVATAYAPATGAVGAAWLRPSVTRELGFDDGALMLRYRQGDSRAFNVLYERHKAALYRYLYRLCRNSETASDLFQEVWSKVVASSARYEVRAQFKTFLFRIAHNSAMDHFRRSARHHLKETVDIEGESRDFLPDQPGERPDMRCAQSELAEKLCAAIAALPSEQRDAFLLYEEAGLTIDEIGRVTGVPLETAKSRLRYAVAKLKKAMAEYAQGTEP